MKSKGKMEVAWIGRALVALKPGIGAFGCTVSNCQLTGGLLGGGAGGCGAGIEAANEIAACIMVRRLVLPNCRKSEFGKEGPC